MPPTSKLILPPFACVTASQKSSGKTHLMVTLADMFAVNGYGADYFQIDDQRRLSHMLGQRVIDLRPDPDLIIDDPTLMTRALGPFYEAMRQAKTSKRIVAIDTGANEIENFANYLRDVDIEEDLQAWSMPFLVFVPFYPEPESMTQSAFTIKRIRQAVKSARIVVVENRHGGSVEAIAPDSHAGDAYRELLLIAQGCDRIVMPTIANRYWAPFENAGIRFVKALALDPEEGSVLLKRDVGEIKVMKSQVSKYWRSMHEQLSKIINLPKGAQ